MAALCPEHFVRQPSQGAAVVRQCKIASREEVPNASWGFAFEDQLVGCEDEVGEVWRLWRRVVQHDRQRHFGVRHDDGYPPLTGGISANSSPSWSVASGLTYV